MTITDEQLLEAVKLRLAITGNFHDALLSGYIKDTKDYLQRAGVSPDTLSDDKCIGVVARGASDLWNFGSGDGKFSVLFMNMATQLILSEEGENG